MASFDYYISVTGDCENTSTGAVTLALSGGTPPYTIEWIYPYVASFIDTIDPVTVTGLYSDTYIVRVNDSTLPINQEFYINIPVSNGVCGEIVQINNTTCGLNNGSVEVTSTSEYSSTNFYLYTTTNEYISSAITNTSNYEFINLSAGTYYLIVEDLGGCSGKTQDFVIEESTPLDYGLYVVPNASCGNGPIGKIYITGLTGTPPYTYVWSNSLTGSSITGLTSGLYSVTVTDSLGCNLSKTATIVDLSPVGFGQFIPTASTCLQNNGSLTLEITGGTEPYYYSASTGYFEISYSQSFTLTGLSAGAYSFNVTDAALCRFQVDTFLASPDGITSVNIISENSNCGKNDGSISVVIQGGSTPYTYTLIRPDSSSESVTNSLSNYVFQNLSGGTYTVFIEDSNGCSYSEEKTILTSDKFIIYTLTTGTTCNLNNGIVTTYLGTGYTLPLTYSLDGDEYFVNTNLTAVTFSNISSGTHVLSVADSTGCQQNKTVFINQSVPLIFSLYSTSCGNGNNGTITAFISSGNPPFTFDWSDNVLGNPQYIQVSGLTGGTYSLTLTDSDGCSLNDSITINCNSLFTSYQSYVMGGELFTIESPTKCGLQQMYNEGYQDLIEGDYGCQIVTATFTAKVTVSPLSFSATSMFFVSSSINYYPPDELWYSTLNSLLLTVPGVGNVIIDSENNLITIETIPNNTLLDNQQLMLELLINYELTCV